VTATHFECCDSGTVLESRAMGRLCSARYEREARQRGWMRIAGLDEAGRGSLFGPVVAAAVILNPKRRIVGLDDSKKLPPERRCELAERIREHAIAWATAEIDSSRIDAWNIYQASRQAMVAALSQIDPLPDYLLLDAIEIDLPIEQKPLIHGDARSISIAAASILAKVERDRRMEEFDDMYPQYGLAQHKGYGTPEHLEALRLFGPTPLHRFSYAPVRQSRCWAAGAVQNALPLEASETTIIAEISTS
jgi:ribonuclease HII